MAYSDFGKELYMILILAALLITLAILILFKLFQRFCLWLVCDCKFNNENTWYCRLTQRLAPILLGIGMGKMPRKVNKK